ncbi:unnamed protein product [marine sediment metagenome]|uniref:Uncharacterized protein n=1 Tax=marine sediment metagenome TaxID=412755 RepID=X1E7H1_9ZZZZ
MNKEFTFFKDTVADILEKIVSEEQNIKKAADIMARNIIIVSSAVLPILYASITFTP